MPKFFYTVHWTDSSQFFCFLTLIEPYQPSGLNIFLPAPQTGHFQSSAKSLNWIPLGILPLRSPRSGSYMYPQLTVWHWYISSGFDTYPPQKKLLGWEAIRLEGSKFHKLSGLQACQLSSLLFYFNSLIKSLTLFSISLRVWSMKSSGFPAGSVRSQSSICAPGTNGHSSPHPIVTIIFG